MLKEFEGQIQPGLCFKLTQSIYELNGPGWPVLTNGKYPNFENQEMASDTFG